MASEGPLSPTAAISTGGGKAWSSPTAVYSSDDSRALTFLGGSESSQQLQATDFNFSIPAGATIDGIEVSIERSQDTLPQDIEDSLVQLIKGGTPSGNNKADTVTAWPTTDATATYGSSSDLWGLSLTPTDINASNFGIAISAYNDRDPGLGVNGRIDHTTITVYYTETTFIPRVTIF